MGGSRLLILMLQIARRHVAVSTCTSMVTQQLLTESSLEAPKARPCRVSTADRSVRKGIMAHSLKDLLHKVRDRTTLSTAQPLGLWLRAGPAGFLCPLSHELGLQQGWSS